MRFLFRAVVMGVCKQAQGDLAELLSKMLTREIQTAALARDFDVILTMNVYQTRPHPMRNPIHVLGWTRIVLLADLGCGAASGAEATIWPT